MYDNPNRSPARGRIPKPGVSRTPEVNQAPPMPTANDTIQGGPVPFTPVARIAPPPVRPDGSVPLSSPLSATPDSRISTPVNREGSDAGEIGMAWRERFPAAPAQQPQVQQNWDREADPI